MELFTRWKESLQLLYPQTILSVLKETFATMWRVLTTPRFYMYIMPLILVHFLLIIANYYKLKEILSVSRWFFLLQPIFIYFLSYLMLLSVVFVYKKDAKNKSFLAVSAPVVCFFIAHVCLAIIQGYITFFVSQGFMPSHLLSISMNFNLNSFFLRPLFVAFVFFLLMYFSHASNFVKTAFNALKMMVCSYPALLLYMGVLTFFDHLSKLFLGGQEIPHFMDVQKVGALFYVRELGWLMLLVTHFALVFVLFACFSIAIYTQIMKKQEDLY